MAAGLPLPKKIICHAHWTTERVKMSKSLNNIIDPFELLDTYTIDMIRFYLLLDGGLHHDGDFSYSALNMQVNSHLCNHYGNLLSRSTSTIVNPSQIYPTPSSVVLPGIHEKLLRKLQDLPESVEHDYENILFGKAIRDIFDVIRDCNVFFEENTPWNLVKEGNNEKLNQVICFSRFF